MSNNDKALEFIRVLASRFDADEAQVIKDFYGECESAESYFGHSDDCLSRGIDFGANNVYGEVLLFLRSLDE